MVGDLIYAYQCLDVFLLEVVEISNEKRSTIPEPRMIIAKNTQFLNVLKINIIAE